MTYLIHLAYLDLLYSTLPLAYPILPTLPYPTLPYLTPTTLPYPTLPYLTLPYPTLPYPTLHPILLYPTLPHPSPLSSLATRRCTLIGEWDPPYCNTSSEFADVLKMVSMHSFTSTKLLIIIIRFKIHQRKGWKFCGWC